MGKDLVPKDTESGAVQPMYKFLSKTEKSLIEKHGKGFLLDIAHVIQEFIASGINTALKFMKQNLFYLMNSILGTCQALVG